MEIFGLPDWVAIFISAILFSITTSFISRKTGVKQKTEHIQTTMKEYQKEMNDAVKKNDQHKIDELKKREAEVMGMMSEMMWLPFKNMIFIIPMFIGVMWVLQEMFPNFLITLPIALHLNGEELLGLNIFKSSVYGSRGFFIISSIVTGMAIEGIIGKLKKKG
ncbi:MAG: EMC3/TMCO1 family protein [Candidatus Micrarchaeota archaeon]